MARKFGTEPITLEGFLGNGNLGQAARVSDPACPSAPTEEKGIPTWVWIAAGGVALLLIIFLRGRK